MFLWRFDKRSLLLKFPWQHKHVLNTGKRIVFYFCTNAAKTCSFGLKTSGSIDIKYLFYSNHISVYAFHNSSLSAFNPKTAEISSFKILTLSWWRSLSYRNQAIDFLCKSVDWFLYDRDLHHERVKAIKFTNTQKNYLTQTPQHPFLNVLNVCSTKKVWHYWLLNHGNFSG